MNIIYYSDGHRAAVDRSLLYVTPTSPSGLNGTSQNFSAALSMNAAAVNTVSFGMIQNDSGLCVLCLFPKYMEEVLHKYTFIDAVVLAFGIVTILLYELK